MSKSTFRGTIMFVLLLVSIFILPDLISYNDPNDKTTWRMYSVKEERIRSEVTSNYRRSQNRDTKRKKSRYHAPPSKFDPNTYQVNDWMKLGLSVKQANVVLKFSKYSLKSNDQLKKIVVISDELFELIKDSTFYPKTEFENNKFQFADKKENTKKQVILDINTATEEELNNLPGIGDFFARSIMKKRDELGGFYSKEQLLEIWKFDQVKLDAIAPLIKVQLEAIKKIDINSAEAKDFKRHPYFSWNLANSIVKLRSQNGKFTHIEEIRKSVLITDEIYEKIRMYLQIVP